MSEASFQVFTEVSSQVVWSVDVPSEHDASLAGVQVLVEVQVSEVHVSPADSQVV